LDIVFPLLGFVASSETLAEEFGPESVKKG